MEQCRQGKSAKRIRNFGKRIGSEGWARGSRPRTRRLSADCSSCSRGKSGSPRAGRGTDRERPPRGPSPGVEQPTQNWYGQGESYSFEQQLGGRNPYRVPGGRSPKEINPKLRICKGSITWYQSSILGVLLPFPQPSIIPPQPPKAIPIIA
ncbi:hypothetical protein C4D60_Mb00t00630 [Musa balbisiana]|uniref:Uncharacterized protein n=1 Tax=Musa balbisiana TaxID=52838 RepID=A0A4S8I576_MUSBA|nr:hypothetical protein C4D60_Mb00t00630 [Musa balbisiana]